MSLSRFAADALVRRYLDGRALPARLHDAVLSVAERRLIAGEMPVIDAALRRDIDDALVASERAMGMEAR